jgi:anionic cell wall polymer biosynthesis LytR-Cps2A-Psr (LCP) family protein
MPAVNETARRRTWRAWRVIAFILLLLLLAVVVGGLVAFRSFRKEVRASNGRVPATTKRALAPSSDVLSKPQLVMIVFDRASLFARTDPDRHLISLLSIPGSAYVRAPSATTMGDVLGTAGAAGLVRLARSALHLQVTHVALLRPHDIAPLVDALGGVQIEDASLSGGFGRPGGPVVLDGAEADHYVAIAGPTGSLTRRQRERAVLEAIITRLASVASLSNLPKLARTFSATVATDLSPRETLALALVRLRSNLSIQCGFPEGSALGHPRSKLMLRQFAGAKPTPRQRARIFPSNGCRATALSVRAPAAVIFFGKQALALFPFVPALAAVAVALDLILLLALLGAPQALVGIVRNGRTRGRRGPGAGVGDAERKEPLPSASVSEVLADRIGTHTAPVLEARAAPAEAVRVNPGIEVALQRLANDVHSPVHTDEASEEEAQATPSAGPKRSYSSAPEPSRDKASQMLRAWETLRAAMRRGLPHGVLREHAETAPWVLVGVATAIVLGYLISQL